MRRYRAMFDVLPMPYDWPVDVNYHEAKAFCSWKGPSYRLSTEVEHHRLRGETVSGIYLYKELHLERVVSFITRTIHFLVCSSFLFVPAHSDIYSTYVRH